MKRILQAFAIVVVIVLTGISWLWWSKPKKVDMASYAPADSLLYLESNSLVDITESIKRTEIWKSVDKLMGTRHSRWETPWFQRFSNWTGIGPIETVIFTRAQIAVVFTELGTTQDGETLRVRPEAAVIIETHTAERRIRPAVERIIKQLAENAYRQPIFRRINIDGIELLEWTAPEGGHQVLATILGSVVIVSNSERTLRTCAAVRAHQRPSLQNDAELPRMRAQLAADRALAFGYVSPSSSARLLSFGIPLILGRLPADSQFEQLISKGAAKTLTSAGWASHGITNGIEDRYLIGLQHAIIPKLKQSFRTVNSEGQVLGMLPQEINSVTCYKFEEPAEAWKSVKSALASQLDVLSAVLFTTLLKSALLSYGIAQPESFLSAVKGQILTIRLNDSAERSMLLASVRDEVALRETIVKQMNPGIIENRTMHTEIFEDAKLESAAGFFNGYVVMGSPSAVRRYIEAAKTHRLGLTDEAFKLITFYVPFSNSASIATYTNDSERTHRFLSAFSKWKGGTSTSDSMEQVLAGLPYAATETNLTEQGIERRTRSTFGQFSTLLALLMPDQSKTVRN